MNGEKTWTIIIIRIILAHVLMAEKRSYTEAESVVKPCLEIVANLLHRGKQSVNEVAQISLFNKKANHCFDIVAEDLKQQLMGKLLETPCFTFGLTNPRILTTRHNLL